MIPTKLFLRNFMCYKENVPPLYLDGIHLACLCGDNGNGKSAIIDAITWALWGKSRAKTDDELIHTGRGDMEVDLDFVVGQTQYRVVRKRTRARRRGRQGQTERPGHTVLDFQVAGEDGFKSISGDSVAQTQQSIIDTLHMDYHTFVNSAFLRQGHADEFTIKPPGERKKVLADILGLSLYDELAEKARERARERERQQSALENSIRDIQQEIAQKAEYESAVAETEAELLKVELEVKEQESRVNSLREKRKWLEFKQEQLTELRKATEQARSELDRWHASLAEHTHRIQDYESLLERGEEVTAGYARLQGTRKEVEEMDRRLQQSFALSRRRDSLAQAISDKKGSKLEEKGRLLSKTEELETRAAQLPRLEEELAKARARQERVAQLEKRLEHGRQKAQDIAADIQYLKSVGSQLDQELKDLRDKLALLAKGDATCPLCETDLGADGKQRIEEKYRAETSAKLDQQRRTEEQIREKVNKHREIARAVAQLESTLDQERSSVQRQIASLENEVSLSKQAATEVTRVRARLAEVEEELDKGEYALAEKQALAEVDQQIAALDYDAQRHQQVRDLLSELAHYEELHRRLEEAERALPSERTALEQAKDAVTVWESTIETNTEKMTALTGEIGALPGLLRELAQAEEDYASVRQRQTEVRDRKIALQERIEYCAQLEVRKKEREQFLLSTLREKEVYEELAEAFGKKGIQAFLIETALPEIEHEANRLLSRMTGDRMRVGIATQRETRKGDVVETLEIKIRDELGTRSYEMYSGGEAFRINLALRIALSKLLARRAGAPLPTLFIDEGFGTQDSNGLVKLIEAINSIQDDFKKIFVISHLEDVKEAFPVRIEVTKTAEGSQISMS